MLGNEKYDIGTGVDVWQVDCVPSTCFWVQSLCVTPCEWIYSTKSDCNAEGMSERVTTNINGPGKVPCGTLLTMYILVN